MGLCTKFMHAPFDDFRNFGGIIVFAPENTDLVCHRGPPLEGVIAALGDICQIVRGSFQG